MWHIFIGLPASERAMAPLREPGEPVMNMSGPQPLAGVHEGVRPVLRHILGPWHSMSATELADDVIDTMADILLDSLERRR